MARSFIENINTFEKGRRQRNRVKVTVPMSDGFFGCSSNISASTLSTCGESSSWTWKVTRDENESFRCWPSFILASLDDITLRARRARLFLKHRLQRHRRPLNHPLWFVPCFNDKWIDRFEWCWTMQTSTLSQLKAIIMRNRLAADLNDNHASGLNYCWFKTAEANKSDLKSNNCVRPSVLTSPTITWWRFLDNIVKLLCLEILRRS